MTVGLTFTKSARRVGIVAASGTAFLGAVYVATLIAGLLSLRSLQQPIPDPLFSFLEIEILLLMPLFVALMVSVHAWAGAGAKVFSLMALVFAGVLAGLTSALHFVILIVGHQAAFSKLSPLLLSFKMALGSLCDRHSWVGHFLRALRAVGGSSLQRRSARHDDTRATGNQRDAGACRAEWRRPWRHAVPQHRNRWLRRCFSKHGGAARDPISTVAASKRLPGGTPGSFVAHSRLRQRITSR